MISTIVHKNSRNHHFYSSIQKRESESWEDVRGKHCCTWTWKNQCSTPGPGNHWKQYSTGRVTSMHMTTLIQTGRKEQGEKNGRKKERESRRAGEEEEKVQMHKKQWNHLSVQAFLAMIFFPAHGASKFTATQVTQVSGTCAAVFRLKTSWQKQAGNKTRNMALPRCKATLLELTYCRVTWPIHSLCKPCPFFPSWKRITGLAWADPFQTGYWKMITLHKITLHKSSQNSKKLYVAVYN